MSKLNQIEQAVEVMSPNTLMKWLEEVSDATGQTHLEVALTEPFLGQMQKLQSYVAGKMEARVRKTRKRFQDKKQNSQHTTDSIISAIKEILAVNGGSIKSSELAQHLSNRGIQITQSKRSYTLTKMRRNDIISINGGNAHAIIKLEA